MSTAVGPTPPSPSTPPPASAPQAKDLDAFEHHWQDEADAAFLYRALADAEHDATKQDLYRRLAAVEDRHVIIWSDLLTRAGRAPKPFVPSARARLLAMLGRTFGPRFLLPMLLAEEGREVRGNCRCTGRFPRVARARGRRPPSAPSRLSTQVRWAKWPAGPGNRGIARSRAAFSGTSSTASTTALPRTLVSSPA